VDALQLTPCPWLLDESGAIDPRDLRGQKRCGADPTRPEIPASMRDNRCLVGGSCAVRDERERLLGPLAASAAPQLPIGDPRLVAPAGIPQATRPIWGRLLAIAVVAVVAAVLSGPVITRITPIFSGSSAVVASASPSASPTDTPAPSASPSASPTDTPAPSASPSASPTATPAPVSGARCGGTPTYVVQSGDTLSRIASVRCGGRVGYLAIARLNAIPTPYRLRVGQVLQLP